MQRRLLGFGSLLLLAACSGEQVVSPDSNQAIGPLFSISSGNPNFAWRPPVANQSATGAFNPGLSPTVRICSLPADNNCSNNAAAVSGGQYQYDWKTSKTPGQFRIHVLVLGSELGSADVNTTSATIPGFVKVNAGATLPVKFVITTDCTVANCVDPNTGGTVFIGSATNPQGGVTVPPQEGGGDPIPLDVKFCRPDLSANGLVVHGSCITIDAPEGTELTNPAIVFICDVLEDLPFPNSEHTHIHKRHGSGNSAVITVLPNESAPLCQQQGANATVGSFLRALAHGNLKEAGKQFLGLVGPKPLYATTMLDRGAGGSTGTFSDFQFAEEVEQLPIGWESGAWSYQIGGSVPSGWQTGPLFALTGAAGFGFLHSANTGEGFEQCVALIGEHTATPWAENTTLYLRRNFFLTEPTTVQISVAIDNDIEIYVDGNDVGPGLLVHDGCATRDSFVRTVTLLPAGVHSLGIKAIDRGFSTYFDAQLTVAGGGGD